MKRIILITFLLANLSFAFGQNLSVETTPQGNGFILDGVSIDFRKAALDATGRGVQFRNDGIYTNYAFVNYNFKGGRNVTKYRYNGKTYTAGYDPNKECNFLPISPIVPVEVTISIRVNGKTYSKTVENLTGGGGIVKTWESFKLDDFVKVDNKSNAVSLVSITVRPLPNIHIEKDIERGEECKKRKENEKKAKEIADKEAEKEAKGQKTNKKDDDFWAGGEETKLTLVATDTKATAKNTNDDFWSGNNTTQQKSNNIVKDDFWAGKGTKEEEIALEKKIAQDSDNQYLGEKEITTQRIKITYRDHGAIDGDRVSVYHNSLNIANNITLRADEQAVNVTLSEGINRITFEALNEGTEGNNTAEFKIYDDKENQIYTNKWSISTGYRGTLIIIKK